MQRLTPTSLYIHIPFCLHRCGYCDFNTYAGKLSLRSAYVDAMLQEINLLQARFQLEHKKALALQTVYFGGGTPSLLETGDLGRILTKIKEVWTISEGAEITLEMNPGTFRQDYFEQIRRLGINRLSIGLQAFDDNLLKKLDRIHTCDRFAETLQAAKTAGFENISVDLMIGLPEQRMAQLKTSLDYLMSCQIPHLSVYSLIIEDGTAFASLYGTKGKERHRLPTEEEERLMHHFVQTYLAKHGLQQYEVSNFARPGFSSRHNLVYWEALPYYALGAGAHQYVQRERRGSILTIEEYIAACTQAERYRARNGMICETDIEKLWPLEEVVSVEEAQKEFFLLGLRKNEGVSQRVFEDRFAQKIPPDLLGSLAMCQKKGLLEYREGFWFLTALGHDMANQVFMQFI